MATSSEKTVKKPRGPGKPFKKGLSGNPAGRPARTPEELDLIRACKDKSSAALDVIEEIMHNGQSDKAKLSAAIAIIERGYGKPMQHSEITGAGGSPLTVQIVRFGNADDTPAK